MIQRLILAALVLLSLLNGLNHALAQGSAFTYHGELSDSGGPLNGSYDLTFTLFDGPNAQAVQIGLPQAPTAVQVSGGLFTVTLEFGPAAFTGQARWLEITVRPHSGGATTTLSPRQQLTPAPYAIYAESAGTLANAGISASQLNTPGSPSSGQVLSFDGTTLFWAAPASGSFTLPYNSGAVPSPTSLFTLNNTGTGPAGVFLGNIGIGTTSPTAPLDVSNGSQDTKLDGNSVLFTRNDGPAYIAAQNVGGRIDFVTGGRTVGDANASLLLQSDMTSLFNGNVGIGAVNPQYPLSVAAQTPGQNAISWRNGSYNLGVLGTRYDQDSGQMGLYSEAFLSIPGGVTLRTNVMKAQLAAAGPSYFNGGFVGIGTAEPSWPLDVQDSQAVVRLTSTDDANGSVIELKNTSSVQELVGAINFNDSSNSYPGQIAYHKDGNMTFKAGGVERMRISQDGNCSVPVLTITGGADIAEPFHLSATNIVKGSVVVIDANESGHLKLSEAPYDKCVAGVVSGANGIQPGLTLSQQGINDGGHNVALSGRVYALADASDCPIKPGDLLTTSATPGHCMKAANADESRGAIIGKAMSSLEKGKGMVLVLVSLQ